MPKLALRINGEDSGLGNIQSSVGNDILKNMKQNNLNAYLLNLELFKIINFMTGLLKYMLRNSSPNDNSLELNASAHLSNTKLHFEWQAFMSQNN